MIAMGMGAFFVAGCRPEQDTAPTNIPLTETPESTLSPAMPAVDTPTASSEPTPTNIPILEVTQEIMPTTEIKKRPDQTFSVYINFDDVNKRESVDRMFEKMSAWGANSVVVEIKDDVGRISIPFDHSLKPQIGNRDRDEGNLVYLVDKARRNGIHLIARQVVMMDKAMYQERGELAVREHDYTEYGWLDPRREEVVEYTAAVSRAAVDFGFSEIQLDYIRFPNAGIRYYLDLEQRTGAINNILWRVKVAINGEALLTADFFGGTPTTPDSLPDMGIGQNIVMAAPFVDGLCPMLYPDVHQSGADVNEYGYVYEGTWKTLEKLALGGNPEAFVTPWIQAYGRGFGLAQIRDQTNAAFNAGGVGVHAWNNTLIYPDGIYIEG